jgi:hypothetical protein
MRNARDIRTQILPEVFDFLVGFVYGTAYLMGAKAKQDEIETGGHSLFYREPPFSSMTWTYHFHSGKLYLEIDHSRALTSTWTWDWNRTLLCEKEERPNEWDFTPIDNMIQMILRGIIPTRSFRPCENIFCVGTSGDNGKVPPEEQHLIPIERIYQAFYIAERWICGHCRQSFSLDIPKVIILPPNGSIKTPEQIERAKMTNSLRFEILQHDNFTCRACGRNPRQHPGTVLHIDHIKPIAHGGLTIKDNLQVLCQECNLAKSDTIMKQMELW